MPPVRSWWSQAPAEARSGAMHKIDSIAASRERFQLFLSCHKSALRGRLKPFSRPFLYYFCYGVQAPLAGASPQSENGGL